MTTVKRSDRNRLQNVLRLCVSAAPLVALLTQSPAAVAGPLKERNMAALAEATPMAVVVNERWIQLYLPETAYDAAAVENKANYTITSTDDPGFSGAGVKAEAVQHRHFPESAPYADDPNFGDLVKINVIYRVYLKMPKALKQGKTYTITPAANVKIGGPYTVTWSAVTPNEAIHVNQVAYVSNGPKIAYLSAWTGQGTIDFGTSTTFDVINEATKTSVFSGNINLDITGDKEPWSKSNVYSMNFSALSTTGKYHLSVPGVGASFSFRISPSAFNDIGYTLIRGLTMQRDGEHGLEVAGFTNWVRPPAHLDDAIVESTGLVADLTGGHMDAGDRGKYPHNMADVSASMLSAIRLFPSEVEALGESLQIPESNNGIPDLIDEAVYELDFLYKVVMNTPKDGTVPFYLRPQNANGTGGYEQGQPPQGKPKRKLYDETQGPNRAETLYAAGALAMAYNTPLVKQYYPAKCAGYLTAAKKAFNGFKSHTTSGSYFKEMGWYDIWKDGPTPYADELLVASVNLLEATGDATYLPSVKAALPANLAAVKKWTWVLTGPWLPAFVSLYHANSSVLTQGIPGVKALAKAAIIDWGDSTVASNGKPYAAPFGAPLPHQVQNQVGWYFSGDQTAFPAMVAYGVTGNTKYRDIIIKTWSYLLGGNPLSRTYVTGLGDPQRSPRWMVHEISHYQWQKFKAGQGGWSEVIPGIPSADIQNGNYDSYIDHPWNVDRKNNKFPAQNTYPALYRYHDSWTVNNEFTIDRLARGAVSIIPLVVAGAPAMATPEEEEEPEGSTPDAPVTEEEPGVGETEAETDPGDVLGESDDSAAPQADPQGIAEGSCNLGAMAPSSSSEWAGWLTAASLLAMARRRRAPATAGRSGSRSYRG